MALAIGQPRSSAKRSLERLEAEHRIKILDTGNAKHSMKILIRYLPESVHIEANPPEPPPVFNMDRFRELLFKFRNPAPLMPDYDRNGRRISPARSELISPLGGLGALIIEKAVLAPAGLTDSQIAERLQRRLDKIKPLLLALLEFGLLVEASGVYRAPADLLERLELELERSGCNAAEERDRRRYETDREARRLFSRERQPEPDGYIEDLEPLERVEASQEPESPGPTPNPVPEQEIAPDALITDASDPDQFRELAHVLRTGLTRLESHRARRSARREARRLDREQGGYERRRDGAHMSPAAFLRSELSGVTAMDYAAMLRRWKAMGGKKETLEGAISAGSYCLKTERMDFNRPYVYPAVSVSRAERGAA